MLIRPILLYAAPVWGNTTKSNIQKLEILQNKILRSIGRAEYMEPNKKIRDRLNINTLEDQIRKLTKNFFEFQTKNNRILSNLGEYNETTAPFKVKRKLLHHILLEEPKRVDN